MTTNIFIYKGKHYNLEIVKDYQYLFCTGILILNYGNSKTLLKIEFNDLPECLNIDQNNILLELNELGFKKFHDIYETLNDHQEKVLRYYTKEQILKDIFSNTSESILLTKKENTNIPLNFPDLLTRENIGNMLFSEYSIYTKIHVIQNKQYNLPLISIHANGELQGFIIYSSHKGLLNDFKNLYQYENYLINYFIKIYEQSDITTTEFIPIKRKHK